MIKCREEVIRCDLLLIGGGMGGLQAAVTASQAGVDVVVAEKADTRRSGSGANGNDHFDCYVPEIHGEFERSLREIDDSMDGGPWTDLNMTAAWALTTDEVIKEWASYGIDMFPTGEYHFEGHGRIGQQLHNLKFNGSQQKPILTKVARKNGARILNKTVITDLLTNEAGRLNGAVGVDLSQEEPEALLFQCKAAMIATGMTSRLFPSSTPAYMFNTAGCPATCGEGEAMAWRAGAKMLNYDVIAGHAGPAYFNRGGKATWIGFSSDIDGKPVVPFVEAKADRALGDVVADMWPGCYRVRLKDGTGPTYMNTTKTSAEDLDYMLHEGMVSEGIDSITDYCEQHHIDLSKKMIEFATYPLGLAKGGLDCDIHARTSIPGLYASGYCIGNAGGSLAGAVGFGKLAAQDAVQYVKTVEFEDVSAHPVAKRRLEFLGELMGRAGKPNAANWKEALSTLQNIMQDYVGNVVSESMLRAAKAYIAQLRERMDEELACENSHELMRTLEVYAMADLTEPVIRSLENRKETRPGIERVDYKFTNTTLNGKYQTIRKKPDGTVEQDFRPRVMNWKQDNTIAW